MKVIPQVIIYNCGIGCVHYSDRVHSSQIYCIKCYRSFEKELFVNGFPEDCPLKDYEEDSCKQ